MDGVVPALSLGASVRGGQARGLHGPLSAVMGDRKMFASTHDIIILSYYCASLMTSTAPPKITNYISTRTITLFIYTGITSATPPSTNEFYHKLLVY